MTKLDVLKCVGNPARVRFRKGDLVGTLKHEHGDCFSIDGKKFLAEELLEHRTDDFQLRAFYLGKSSQ